MDYRETKVGRGRLKLSWLRYDPTEPPGSIISWRDVWLFADFPRKTLIHGVT